MLPHRPGSQSLATFIVFFFLSFNGTVNFDSYEKKSIQNNRGEALTLEKPE